MHHELTTSQDQILHEVSQMKHLSKLHIQAIEQIYDLAQWYCWTDGQNPHTLAERIFTTLVNNKLGSAFEKIVIEIRKSEYDPPIKTEDILFACDGRLWGGQCVESRFWGRIDREVWVDQVLEGSQDIEPKGRDLSIEEFFLSAK